MKKIFAFLIFTTLFFSNAYADSEDGFLWDLTKDMTKAVASELVKTAVAEGLDNNKSENEIKRLHEIINKMRRNKLYEDGKIQELEDRVNKLKNILSELKSGKSTQLQKENISTLPYGRWFVILGSYKAKDYQKASNKKAMLEKRNFIGVEIYNTDDYPNLENGLHIVNIGPLSKKYALDLKDKLKVIIPDAYIKSGW